MDKRIIQILILSIIILTSFISYVHSLELYPIVINGKYGYINKYGNIVITPQYRLAYPFKEGYGRVMNNSKKYGFIDETGQFKIKPVYIKAEDFSNGLAVIAINKENKKVYGFIDKTGKIVIEPKYEYAWSFSDGYAVVFEKYTDIGREDTVRIINKKGEFLGNKIFDWASDF